LNSRLAAGLFAAALVVSCSWQAGTSTHPSPPSVSTASAASIAVQPADVPSALRQCSQSGSIDSYLNAIKATDPVTYSRNRYIWIEAQAAGATAAQFVFYSDSDAHCKALMTADGPPQVPVTYPFLENFVIKFKDELAASREYSGSVFGIPPTAYGKLSGGVVGRATGLGPNSESYLCCGSYTAIWQNNAFAVVIWIVNLDSATSARIVSNVNSRID
jgi:hypothetical protein